MKNEAQNVITEKLFGKNDRFLIKHLWIISNGGVLICNINVENKNTTNETGLDPYLFSSFISAIRSFSNEIYGEGKHLDSFSIGKDIYYIYNKRSPKTFLVAKSEFLSFDNQIGNLLDVIEEKFYCKYFIHVKSEIINYGEFKEFTEDIMNLLSKYKITVGNYGDLNNYFPNLNNPLRLIEKSKIFCLIFLKNKKVKQTYINKNNLNKFNLKLFLKNMQEIWKFPEKSNLKDNDNEILSFCLNLLKFKVSGIRFYDFTLYLIVSKDIELNQLETQSKLIIEQLIEHLQVEDN
ncbi:MAG: hypothetical protein ACTSRZ_09105 [Promethearchaeota archaeon]